VDQLSQNMWKYIGPSDCTHGQFHLGSSSSVSLWILLYNKIDMTGVQGLVFSILPSFLLSVIGWIIKKKLCTERLHHGTDEEGQQQVGRSHSEGGTVAEMHSMLQEHEQTA